MALGECLANNTCEFNRPVDGDVLAPFVKLTIQASGVVVTVGNESAPQNDHHACIMSMNFGVERTGIAKVTIQDEQGSSFVAFMETLLKDLKCETQATAPLAELEFGWVEITCNGAVLVEKNPTPFVFIVKNVACDFSGGKFRYELELTDMVNDHAEARDANIKGFEAQNGVHMVDAIRQVLTDPEFPPSVGEVQFLRLRKDGKGVEPIRFKYWDDDPEKGQKGRWESSNVDKLNVVQEWLAKNVSEDGKGFIITYDPTSPKGRIIVWEDPKPGCGETIPADCPADRSYIVNGGKDSPVLSFNPKFNWTFTQLSSSGGSMGTRAADAEPGEGGKNPGPLECETLRRARIKSAGAQNTTSASQIHQDAFNGSKPDQVQRETLNASLLANFDIVQKNIITADLVIQGDPNFPSPFLIKAMTVNLVFINPFHLFPTGGGSGGCPEWLAAPFCNEVLTNKAWRIDKINHQVELGKFTTTLTLQLAAPGATINVGEPFGGPGSGGWTPPSQCGS